MTGDVQSEPRAPEPGVVDRVDLREGSEQPLQALRLDADPRVDDLDTQPTLRRAALGMGARTHGDPPLVRELDGVADQVDEDLLEAHRIGLDPLRYGGLGGELELEELLVRLPAQELLHAREHLRQRARLPGDPHLARLQLGQVQDVVDQAQEVVGAATDVADPRLLLLAIDIGPAQQLGVADDRVHRRAELVAHVGEELALVPVRRPLARHGLLEVAGDDLALALPRSGARSHARTSRR